MDELNSIEWVGRSNEYPHAPTDDDVSTQFRIHASLSVMPAGFLREKMEGRTSTATLADSRVFGVVVAAVSKEQHHHQQTVLCQQEQDRQDRQEHFPRNERFVRRGFFDGGTSIGRRRFAAAPSEGRYGPDHRGRLHQQIVTEGAILFGRERQGETQSVFDLPPVQWALGELPRPDRRKRRRIGVHPNPRSVQEILPDLFATVIRQFAVRKGQGDAGLKGRIQRVHAVGRQKEYARKVFHQLEHHGDHRVPFQRRR
mmetsp:Transcript_24062/g.56769  ORF Transcript_24062/g.56769 Transcript_24062/m.56769 type:complete len:256 (+) Transcript_24062:124-891(+)